MKPRLPYRALCVLLVLFGHVAHAATGDAAAPELNVTVQENPVEVESSPGSESPAPDPDRALLTPESSAVPLPASTETTTAPITTVLPVTVTTETTAVPESTAPITTAVPDTVTTVTTALPESAAPITTAVPDTVTPETTAVPGSTAPITTALPATEAPTTATVPPLLSPQGCLCDLTPGFCDIGCCCDIGDCDVPDLDAVFTGCPEKVLSGACIDKWLMFRANVNPSLVTITDSLFCVRPEEKAVAAQPVPAVRFPTLASSLHFSSPGLTAASVHTRDFYRVDDVILTYFSNLSVRGVLRQPSPGAASKSCIDRNPAQFMRSVSLSCTRTVTLQSCTSDPSLSAHSYVSDLSLIKIPIAETAQVSDFLIPVTAQSNLPSPSVQKDSCNNVVKHVEFVIGYTSRGELAYATVNVVLADVMLNQLLSQTHSVQFQHTTPSPAPAQGPIPAIGLIVGSPITGRFDEAVKPLSIMGVSQGGECSSDPSTRAHILFAHNIITGCTFRSQSTDCLDLRSQIHGILQGLATPDLIAMNFASQPDWTRVITQECPVSSQETCNSGCFLPHSLSVQVLWARQGLLDHPQNYILGAKYVFHCQKVKCPLSSPLTLTTKVIFADTTVYPQPPRGSPQPHWKFPFGFFTRGADELDQWEPK